MKDVVILGGKRTPMGEYNGALSDLSALELGAIAAKAALETTTSKVSALNGNAVISAVRNSTRSRTPSATALACVAWAEFPV